MDRVMVCLLCLLSVGGVYCQEDAVAPTTTENVIILPPNSSSLQQNSTYINNILSDERPVWEPPEVFLQSTSGVDIPQGSKMKTTIDFKPLPVHFIQKFSNWFRPIYEKWSRIKNFLAYPDHPNYGNVQLPNPQEIWEKWHEKGHHFLTGINGAVYGLAPSENHDYPFAYRGLAFQKKSTVQQKNHPV